MGTDRGDFDPKAFGAFAPLYDTYVGWFEDVGRAFGVPPVLTPVAHPAALSEGASAPLKAAVRCQLEVMGYLNRRTQALLQAPTRFSSCRSPQDVLNEQMAFWQTAAEQYAETSRRIADAWAGVSSGTSAEKSTAVRDYIDFNGSSDPGGASSSREREDIQPRSQRRVA